MSTLSQFIGGIPPAASGLVLLATITPTVSANVDFLTTFSSTYDHYLINVDGIVPSDLVGGGPMLFMQVATNGSTYTGANYFLMTSFDSDQSAGATGFRISPAADHSANSGKGCSATIHISNSGNIKTISSMCASQSNVLGNYRGLSVNGAIPLGALSGVRFYWGNGTNFAATGKIRVYGYANS